MHDFWLDVLGSLVAAVLAPVVVVAAVALFPLHYLMILTRPFGRRIPGIKKAYDWWEEKIGGHAYIQIGLDY